MRCILTSTWLHDAHPCSRCTVWLHTASTCLLHQALRWCLQMAAQDPLAEVEKEVKWATEKIRKVEQEIEKLEEGLKNLEKGRSEEE